MFSLVESGHLLSYYSISNGAMERSLLSFLPSWKSSRTEQIQHRTLSTEADIEFRNFSVFCHPFMFLDMIQ